MVKAKESEYKTELARKVMKILLADYRPIDENERALLESSKIIKI